MFRQTWKKMFSWHVSCVAVGLIFNINKFLSGSFVYAGAFIRPWIYYMSGKRFFQLRIPTIAIG